MTSITVTLPWPPAECSPNSRAHWAKRSNIAQQAHDWAYWATELQNYYTYSRLVFEESIQAHYEFQRPDKRKRDLDNFVARCKPYLDGICKRAGIDDSQIKHTVAEWGDKHPGGQVVITLETMDDE